MCVDVAWENKFMSERSMNSDGTKPLPLQTMIAIAKIEAVKEFSGQLKLALEKEVLTPDGNNPFNGFINEGVKKTLGLLHNIKPEEQVKMFKVTQEEAGPGNRDIALFLGWRYQLLPTEGWVKDGIIRAVGIYTMGFENVMMRLSEVVEVLRKHPFTNEQKEWYQVKLIMKEDVYKTDISILWRAVVHLIRRIKETKR